MPERTELINIPGSVLLFNLGDVVMDNLVADGKLPHDFQFRLLGVNQEERPGVATADIMQALGYGEGSGHSYLTDPLPDCAVIPGFHDTSPLRPLLSSLDEDYHSLGSLYRVAENMNVMSYIATQSWALYFRLLSPQLYHTVITKPYEDQRGGIKVSKMTKGSQWVLSRTIIKDAALLQIYNEEIDFPHRTLQRQRLLHYLLADNHPELGPDPK